MAKHQQTPTPDRDGERLAKVMARAGLCSRREAERWVTDGRVSVNGKVVTSPVLNVSEADRVVVDGRPLPEPGETRLWRYHKPAGLVVSRGDPQGRATVFEKLPLELPRVVSVGRLDINTEGLLLLTNDGGLARKLELPATGWTRRYRVRVYGRADPSALAGLRRGITLNGIRYGPIEARIDSEKGGNVWLTLSLTEGKNREVKLVLEHLGLTVNRLIRVAFGPFQLGDLARGGVDEVPRRVLRDQLGQRLGGSLAKGSRADRRR